MWHAGQRHSIPHLYIAGHSPRPARRLDDTKERRSFTVAVAIRFGHPNLVVELPTPAQVEARAHSKKGAPFLKPDNPPSSALTSRSYTKRVLHELLGAGNTGGHLRRSPRNPVRLVHDRSPVHTAVETLKYAREHNIVLTTLPARAADLDPLDYGVFGAVKKEWRRRVAKERLGWEQQCTLLIQLLQQADVSAAIKALPSRIQRCIAAKGSRFEK